MSFLFLLTPLRRLPVLRVLALSCLLLSGAACNRDAAESPGGNAMLAASTAPENPVTHWSLLAIDLMKDPGPVIDSRAYAILHAAMHDAVNGIERRYRPYAADLSAPGASLEAAVATAARDVMIQLSPSTRENTEAAYRAALDQVKDDAARDAGIALGRRAAAANLARREGDGIPVGTWPPSTGPITRPVYQPTGEPGDYAFTPPFDRPPLGPIALFPGWGRLRPFVTDLSRHTLGGPFKLTSAEYAADLDSLKLLGSVSSTVRTPDQGETAFFWYEELAIWHGLANRVLRETGANPWDAARTLALLHFAMTDAGIACFDAKYRFRFWRPITAIRKAGDDGNSATTADPNWLPLLSPEAGRGPEFVIPPIPDYPSAAATLASAAAEVLGRLLGDAHVMETTSPTLPGVTRRFTSFSQMARENGRSRVYGGIHFLHAVEDGFRLGKGIGEEVSGKLEPAR